MSWLSGRNCGLAAVIAVLGAGCAGQSSDGGAGSPAKVASRGHFAPRGDVLGGRHASREVSDYEGPAKPNTAHPLSSRSYRVILTGHQERPQAVSAGTVHAVITLRPKTRQVCWRFGRLAKLRVSTAAFGRVREVLKPINASIHSGTRLRNGPLVVLLGARYTQRDCTVVQPVVLNSIRIEPRLFYLNLANGGHPSGAVRGQL